MTFFRRSGIGGGIEIKGMKTAFFHRSGIGGDIEIKGMKTELEGHLVVCNSSSIK